MKQGAVLLGMVALAGNLHAADPSAAAARERKAELKAFDRADKNDDGLLDKAEFDALIRPLATATLRHRLMGRGIPEGLQQAADALFNWFDADQDGSIDPGEWLDARSSARTFDYATNPFSMAVGFGSYHVARPGLDANGNGEVSRAEALGFLNGVLPAAAARACAHELEGPDSFSGSSSGSVGGVVGQWSTPDPGAAAAWLAGVNGSTVQGGWPPLPSEDGGLVSATSYTATPGVFSSQGGTGWVLNYDPASGAMLKRRASEVWSSGSSKNHGIEELPTDIKSSVRDARDFVVFPPRPLLRGTTATGWRKAVNVPMPGTPAAGSAEELDAGVEGE